MKKRYRILKNSTIIKSNKKGKYAGWAPGKIFGTVDCKSGRRMHNGNIVFFHNLEDAVNEGYRPCKNCKPLDEKSFESIKHLTNYNTLEEFYNRDK